MWPFVSRAAYEAVVYERDLLHCMVQDGRERAKDAEARAYAAQARAQAAQERAVQALAESRLVISEARSTMKAAALAMFGEPYEGAVPKAPSVAESDREAARAQQEAANKS